jgi:hypothetical protein
LVVRRKRFDKVMETGALRGKECVVSGCEDRFVYGEDMARRQAQERQETVMLGKSLMFGHT